MHKKFKGKELNESQYLLSINYKLRFVNTWLNCSVISDSCDPMDYSLPGSSVHGIFQARILEWVAISFSRGSS